MLYEVSPLLQVVVALASLTMFVEGIALSRGAAWAYRWGIPLPWRHETIPMGMPREAIDLADRVDKEHSFETDHGRSVFYLDRDEIGLLYWKVSFARNSHWVRSLRGLGAAATGIVEIDRGAGQTRLRWRPVLRLSPLLVLFSLIALAADMMPQVEPLAFPVGIWTVFYLGVLLWTLHRLPAMYESVSAQLVARATERGSR